MKEYEYSAKTVEEAIEKGLQELGLSIGDVEVRVTEEGSKGLFGFFGSRMAKVTLVLKEEDNDLLDSLMADEKPAKKEAAGKGTAEKIESGKEAAEKDNAGKKEPVRRRTEKKETPVKNETYETAAPEVKEAEAEKKSENTAWMPAPVKRENRRSADKKKEKKPAEEKADKPAMAEKPENQIAPANDCAPEADREPAGDEGRDEAPREILKMEKPEVHMLSEGEITPESPAGIALDFLKNLTRLMGVEVDIQMGTDEEGNVFGYMNGDTLGILIGRRGETLDAVQYLTSLKVNRGKEEYTRVTLDTENYRERREDTLIRLANRMANRAVRTGRRVSLEPMNPYERRVIHFALQQNDRVDTHSEGDEPNRHVVITLKK